MRRARANSGAIAIAIPYPTQTRFHPLFFPNILDHSEQQSTRPNQYIAMAWW
jgi:hypothetical protein